MIEVRFIDGLIPDDRPSTLGQTPSSGPLPLEERIRRRAHELYVQCGNLSGSEMDDWLQAEEEILRAHNDALPASGLEAGR